MVDPPSTYTGRAKKLGQCHYCSGTFSASSLEVDHVSQAGQCTDWDTAAAFLKKLLDCNTNWVLACKPCHKIKSYAERTGTSFEVAMVEKKVLAWTKKPKEEVVAFCKEKGYTDAMLRTAPLRRKALSEILSKEIK